VLRPFVAITPSNPLSINAMSPHRIRSFLRSACLVTLAALGLTACGGGGGSSAPPATGNLLSVSASGGGRVVSVPAGIDCGAACTSRFAPTASVTLTATADTGRVFSGWGGDCAGTAATCTVSMQAARTVTASFNAPPAQTFTLDVGVTGSGTLRSQPAGIDCGATCSAAFPSGATVSLSATPATGQVLSGWGGACTGAGTTCTVTMNQARSVSVVFAAAPPVLRTLSVSLTGDGSVRSQPVGVDCGTACSASFGDGTSVVLTATPATGQRFSGWSGACAGAVATCTVAMSQDRSVGAAFAVASAAPAWQTPQLLEESEDFDVTTRVLTAVSPVGDAIVMWEQSDGVPNGSTRKVFSRRYAAGQGWDAAVVVPNLSGTGTQRLLEGQVLMDAAGTATWLRPNLETRRFTAAGGWGAPFVPPPRSGGLLTSAVMDATGAIGVLISGSDVYNISLPANANSWLAWVRLDTAGNLVTDNAAVAISADGTAMAIWRESNPGDSNYSVKAARYVPTAGGWQAPQSIDNSFDNVNPDSPMRVAMDAAGNAIAVWHQGNSIYTNVFSATGGWGAAAAVDVNAVSSVFSARIRLVMTPTGRAVVAWNSGIFAIKSMQYTPGSGFSAPALVNSYGIDSGLGLDADGNAVIVYVAPDRWPSPTTDSDVYSRRLTWGGAWSDAVAIEPLDGRGADAFSAFNQDGKGVAAWIRGDVPGSSSRKSLWVNVLR